MFSRVMQYSFALCQSFVLFAGSGFPCRIAFSNAGVRDIYLIPVARGISGKLILAEKHPFRSQRGVVIAIAPLAGLSVSSDIGKSVSQNVFVTTDVNFLEMHSISLITK